MTTAIQDQTQKVIVLNVNDYIDKNAKFDWNESKFKKLKQVKTLLIKSLNIRQGVRC